MHPAGMPAAALVPQCYMQPGLVRTWDPPANHFPFFRVVGRLERKQRAGKQAPDCP